MYIILKSSIIKLSASFKHSSNYYDWMLYPSCTSKMFSSLEHYFNFAVHALQEKHHYNINAYDRFCGYSFKFKKINS